MGRPDPIPFLLQVLIANDMIRAFFSVVFLGVAGATLFLYTRPEYDHIRELQVQVAGYDEALTKAAELQRLKQELLSRYNAFNPSDIARLRKLLPDHVDNVALILDLDKLAGTHGMGLENVDVSAPASAGQQSQSAVGIVAADSGQKYDSLTLTFTTRGTYQDFTLFMRDLQSSLRIVDLSSLSINPASVVGPEPLYTYKVALRTYWLK